MGVVQDQPGLKCCQSCNKSIAMLFPSSECDCIGGRLAVCVRLTVSQLVRPHRPSCFLGQLNKVENQKPLLICSCNEAQFI